MNPHRSSVPISSSAPIAIIGCAFRFPGDLSDPTDFWEALRQGRDLVTRVPADRWAVDELQHDKRSEPGRSVTFSAGVLSRIDEFDAGFFGISPREAAVLDPQQRLLLELAWEALENAGVPPADMAGADCAVYVGISGFDYGMRGLDDLSVMTAHSMTGNTLSIAANRLSYVFDLRGPSLAVDTACSSSLVALHHACNALRSGEASSALVGGVNLLLHPFPFVGFTKASMLSADGRCKAFDAAGDGYVRAEGGAVLLLKPLDAALADGDDIQAVILASGVNADGARKTGITIPSSEGQAELMREVLARSGLQPADIDFLEAHGTGTAVGDPIETRAIGSVYGQQRSAPLPIGSVKANLGHLEPASGMAGLVKAMLALQHRALPPALHLHTPNPYIDFKALNLELVTEYKSLATPAGENRISRPLVAGVNSFGFGGANAHVLLQEFIPPPAAAPASAETGDHVPPLFLSARSEAGLLALAGRYADLLDTPAAPAYYDLAHAAVHRRERMEKRLAVSADSVASIPRLLRQVAKGASPAGTFVEESLPQTGGIAFVYSGNGSQWAGMGRTLLAESPRFAAILADVDEVMQPQAGFSVLAELEDEAADARLGDTTIAQPLLFALQVALTLMLRELGVRPMAVTGHSVGEVAAAWAAGALDLPQAVRVICARSQAQGLTRGTGRMAAVALSVDAARQLIGASTDVLDVEIAGINSPGNVTLSGSLDSLQRIQAQVESTGGFFRLLDLDYAFHSRQMDPIEAGLAEHLAGLSPAPAGPARFVSTVTGGVLDGTALDAGYWWRNVREPVQFWAATATLAGLGCRVFVEIGPHAILQRYIAESLAELGSQGKGRVLPSLRRNDDGLARITETAFRTHLLAGQPDLAVFFPHPGRRVRLPNYPWQRERHWMPWTSEGLRSIDRRRVHPLLGWRLVEAELAWENTLDPLILPWLADHRVAGAIVFPGAAYAEMALAAGREWLGGEHLILEQLDIVAPLVFDGEHARSIRLVVNSRDGALQINSRQRLSNDEWTLHAVGRLLEAASPLAAARIAAPSAPTIPIDPADHYRRATRLGLDYGPAFQGLGKGLLGGMREEKTAESTLEVAIELPDTLTLQGYLLHPALLDIAFQTLVDFFGDEIDAGQGIALLPVKLGRLDYQADAGAGGTNIHRLRARLRRRSARSVLADFELLDDADRRVAALAGCRFRAAPLKHAASTAVSRWQVTARLQPHPCDGRVTRLPSIADLARQARNALAGVEPERQRWFKETLPLFEALTVSFAHEAFAALAATQSPANTPLARWLADLLASENLLRRDGDAWLPDTAAAAELPSSRALWQVLLRDSPASLPHLALLGRLGAQLPALLRGESSGTDLLSALRHSPVAETLYSDDPAYAGTHGALQALLQEIARGWPATRRLRVLEVAAGPGALVTTLTTALAEDRLDYVLALPDESMQARQAAEWQDSGNVVVATLAPADWQLVADRPLPDAFDVVILRHTLHRAAHPQAALAQARRWLAAGGLLLLAERHPDWSANLLEGLDPAWWHVDEARPQTPLPALLPPETWELALADAGYADGEIFFEPAAEGLAEGAFILLAKRPVDAATEAPRQEAARWLLLADEAATGFASQLRTRLGSLGHQVGVAAHLSATDCREADHVVHLRGWADTPEQAATTLQGLLAEVQCLAAAPGKVPRLWLATRGGARGAELPASADLSPSPAQSALWGFGRVVMNECPQLACTLIDLACPMEAATTVARFENELLQPDGATEIILSAAARHVLALEAQGDAPTRPVRADERFRLDFHLPGRIGNLRWLAEASRPVADDEIEVRTRAAGLNFRDVMYLMGLLPDEAVENGFAGASLGLEFSGVVSRVGARVKDLQPGDAVMGFGASCFASHVVTRAAAVAPMPAHWNFAAAATVPTVFLTVYYALKQLADVQPGERVLIHGGAGGVGIAAIQLAGHLGAEVFATAGTDEKREFVRLLGADRVFDSRSLAFADDVLAATAGEGVDVVLNSLAGEAMRRSLDVLKPFGRFLELGKRDFYENTPVGLRPFKNNISYFGIDADQLLTGRPKLAARLFREVMALFREQALAPLPYRAFAANRVVDAFRVMQQARHIGKIVVTLAEASPSVEHTLPAVTEQRFARESAWLVTGGLSGFGLESARWLAARGVGHLVLVGRRGLATPGADAVVAALAAQGVKVWAEACDIGDGEAVAALIGRIKQTLPPLKGVLHAAASFDDRLITRLDAAGIDGVLQAKLLGAWHLHQATLDIPLEHFVLYSSITTAIGNPGQANYVAANAGLEGLATLRRQMGLPATCIGWGPIGDAGYLQRHASVKDSLEQRLGKPPLGAAEALAQLDRALAEDRAVCAFANFDWNTLARLLPSASASRFTLLNRHRQASGQTGETLDIRALLAGKSPTEVATLVRDLVVQEVAKILCIGAERIEPNRSLHDLGMDSLMAVELALGLEQRFAIQLPVMMLNDAPTADNVTARIVDKLLGGSSEAAETPQPAAVIAGLARQHGEGLTDEEIRSLGDEARKLAENGMRLIA